jgi:hypothetical protein
MPLRHSILVVFIIPLWLAAGTASAQQLFYEDFRPGGEDGTEHCTLSPSGAGTYPFADGWLLRNVDQAAPDAQVAYVNAAWEVREDFNDNVNQCVAFSTSWYEPAAASDDWMWTPLIAIPSTGATLSWRAKTYDARFRDGYEVRVMKAEAGTPGGADGELGNQLSASTQVFSVDQENTGWTAHSLSLADFAGHGIRIAFRNNSIDKFLLVVDDVRVVADHPSLYAYRPAEITPYTRLPLALAPALTTSVLARNYGNIALTQVVASATLLRNGQPVGVPVLSQTLATLAVGALQEMQFQGELPVIDATGEWTIRYLLVSAESQREANVADNQVDAQPVLIGGSEIARYEGDVLVHLGFGNGTGGEIGTQFEIPATTTIAGLHFEMRPLYVDDQNPDTWTGRTIVAHLRALDTASGQPGEIIATTVGVPTTLEGGKYDLPFTTGALTLGAGSYVATVVEPTGGGPMPLPGHRERFYPESTWVIWPGIAQTGWAHLEDFGDDFRRMPQISLLLGLDLFRDGLE